MASNCPEQVTGSEEENSENEEPEPMEDDGVEDQPPNSSQLNMPIESFMVLLRTKVHEKGLQLDQLKSELECETEIKEVRISPGNSMAIVVFKEKIAEEGSALQQLQKMASVELLPNRVYLDNCLWVTDIPQKVNETHDYLELLLDQMRADTDPIVYYSESREEALAFLSRETEFDWIEKPHMAEDGQLMLHYVTETPRFRVSSCTTGKRQEDPPPDSKAEATAKSASTQSSGGTLTAMHGSQSLPMGQVQRPTSTKGSISHDSSQNSELSTPEETSPKGLSPLVREMGVGREFDEQHRQSSSHGNDSQNRDIPKSGDSFIARVQVTPVIPKRETVVHLQAPPHQASHGVRPAPGPASPGAGQRPGLGVSSQHTSSSTTGIRHHYPHKQQSETHKQEIKLGLGRLLQTYGRSHLFEFERANKCSIRLTPKKYKYLVEIESQTEHLHECKEAFDALVNSIKYSKREITQTGICHIVSEQWWILEMKDIEADYQCVIETREIFSSGEGRPTSTAKSIHSARRSPQKDAHTTQENIFEIGNIKLNMVIGDIIKRKAGIVVDTIAGQTMDLENGGSVAQAFMREGQQKLISDYKRMQKKFDPAETFMITEPTRNIKSQKVFHIRLWKWKHQETEQKVETLIWRCLTNAIRLKMTSIAFPVIGSGKLRYPQHTVAACFQKAITTASQSHDCIRPLQVTLVAFDQKSFDDVASHFPIQYQLPGRGAVSQSYTSTNPVHGEETVAFHVNAFQSDVIEDVFAAIDNKLRIRSSGKTTDFHMSENISLSSLLKHGVSGKSIASEIEKIASGKLSIRFDKDKLSVDVKGHTKDVLQFKSKILQLFSKPENPSTYTSAATSQTKPYRWTQENKGAVSIPHSKVSAVDVDEKLKKSVSQLFLNTYMGHIAGQASKKNIVIKSVYRVQNTEMQREYDKEINKLSLAAYHIPAIRATDAKEDVLTFTVGSRDLNALLKPTVNEVFLFHGTLKDNVKKIEDKGLDENKMKGNGQFGEGLYFAESSLKSDQYTDIGGQQASGDHYMFVMRVLLGKPLIVTRPRPFQGPPCGKCSQDGCATHGPKQTVDSIIGIGRDWNTGRDGPLAFREFVLFNKKRCYPEFVVKYERK